MAALADHQILPLKGLLSTQPTSSNIHWVFYSTLIISILFPTYRLILHDYHSWLSLGPGGAPSTFTGYLRVNFLRLLTIKDPFVPPPLTPAANPRLGYLSRLPARSGPRPTVAGIVPQRQTDQKATPDLHRAFSNAIHSLAAKYPALLRTGTSCFEKNGLALFSSLPHHLNNTCRDTAEICHLHAIDSSMHLTLHPSDAALVIATGWGERHPLAGAGWFGQTLLPSGFVMVYAPRGKAELEVLMEIVKAGGWWVGGLGLGKMEGKTGLEERVDM